MDKINIKQGDFISVIGPNNGGKTTFLKQISKELKIDGLFTNDLKLNGTFKDNFNNELINKYIKELKIEDLVDYDYSTLSDGEKQILNFVYLITKEKTLLFDDSFSMLDSIHKQKVYKILKRLNKTGVTIINVVSNTNDVLFSKSLIIVNKDKIVIGNVKELLEEKVFKDNGLELPFVVELSNKLKYYGLLNETIYDIDKMVDKLWK